jgi:hypothetical protein
VSCAFRAPLHGFAVIRDDGCVYKGVATEGGLLPGLPNDGVYTRDLAAAGEDMPLAITIGAL